MGLGFGQVVSLFTTLHPAIGSSRIDARLKNFQKVAFPSADILVGTGWRAEYDPASIWRLALAFELVSIGLPPAGAVSAVDAGWDACAPALKQAWAGSSYECDLVLTPAMHGPAAGKAACGLRPSDDPALLDLQLGETQSSTMIVIDGLKLASKLHQALEEMSAPAAVVALDNWSRLSDL